MFGSPFTHERMDRLFGSRRSGDHRELSKSRYRHIERSRYRCSRKREYINTVTYLFDPLFVHHSKSMFLIDDQKSESCKKYIFREETMCPEYDIDRSFSKSSDHLSRLCITLESREYSDFYSKIPKSCFKRLRMLECQNHER